MSKKRILIVDDDPDCLFQLGYQLKSAGYDVIALGSEQEANQWIEHHKPDLAVVDLMMEREDSGFTLSRALKKKYPELPVIILTAVTPETGFSFHLRSAENRKWIYADLYIEKSMNREKISEQIKQMIKE